MGRLMNHVFQRDFRRLWGSTRRQEQDAPRRGSHPEEYFLCYDV